MNEQIVTVLGNPLSKWLTAALVAAGIYLAFLIIKKLICLWLDGRAHKNKIIIDDILLAAARKTKIFFYMALAGYGGSLFVSLSHTARVIIGKTAAVASLFQIGVWGTALLTSWFEHKIKVSGTEDGSRNSTIKLLNYVSRAVLWAIILLLVLDNLGVKITTLVAGLGIGGVAVALAVQNVLGDLLAFVSIILDKPFVAGDYIQIDAFEGTVEHIGLKTTRVRSLFGEQLVFSNTDLLKGRIKNYKRMSERRVVLPLNVVRETSCEKLALIPGLVKGIIDSTDKARFDRAHLCAFGESSYSFEIIYWVEDPVYRVFMDIQQAVDLEVLKKLRSEGIELAVPVRRVVVEEKRG